MDETSMLLGWLAGRRIAAQRKKQTEVWETVFDGQVVAQEQDNGMGYGVIPASDPPVTSPGFVGGDTVRCTVNGVSKVFTAQQDSLGGWFGNEYLVSDEKDTGYDYHIADMTYFTGLVRTFTFYSRIPGDYNVKLEVIRADLPRYSYNGTILGELPADWDKDTYPYIIISKNSQDNTWYDLFAYVALPTSATGTEGELRLKWELGSLYQTATVYTDMSLWWGEVETDTLTALLPAMYKGMEADSIVWSNFDVLNTDGSVYLAASEPVRV